MAAAEQAAERREAAAAATSPKSQGDKQGGKSGAGEKAKDNDEPEVQIPKNLNRINSFQELNWKDPFPDPEPPKARFWVPPSKKKLEKKNIKELVYDESKFQPGAPPTMTFIPAEAIMRKMMRVCTEVKAPHELYYIF